MHTTILTMFIAPTSYIFVIVHTGPIWSALRRKAPAAVRSVGHADDITSPYLPDVYRVRLESVYGDTPIQPYIAPIGAGWSSGGNTVFVAPCPATRRPCQYYRSRAIEDAISRSNLGECRRSRKCSPRGGTSR